MEAPICGVPMRRMTYPSIDQQGNHLKNFHHDHNKQERSQTMTQPPPPPLTFNLWLSFWNSYDPPVRQQKKRVSFAPVIRVVLIPTRTELVEAGIHLWLSIDDVKHSQVGAYNDAMKFSPFFVKPDLRKLVSIAYQPRSTRTHNFMKVLIVKSTIPTIEDDVIQKLSSAFAGATILAATASLGSPILEVCATQLTFDVVVVHGHTVSSLAEHLLKDLRNCCDGALVGIFDDFGGFHSPMQPFDYITSPSLLRDSVFWAHIPKLCP